MQSRVIQVLTAGRKNQPMLEEQGHGVFTRKFLDGLLGHADSNRDGIITGTELAAWMHPRVAQASDNKQDMQFGNLDGEGQFFFLLPQTAPSAQSPGTQVAVGVYPPTPAGPKTLRNSIGMEFVRIEAGTFQMGSNDSEAYDNEKPVHTVRLTQPYYLGKHEVTQGQWQAVMETNPSKFTGDPNRPVESVSWDDVQEFIRRLNSQEGGAMYRLPTEAEWEYAARAGTTTRWSFGDDARQLGRYAWYNENAGRQTHPVGQLQPNPWGLYDIHGNVWERVQDWYGTYTSGTAVDPTGPSSGSSRVSRGGSWVSKVSDCRSASRFHDAPILYDNLGFRLLRVAQ